MSRLSELNESIISCTKCPRLIAHCRSIAEKKRAAYNDWEYWGKPVPNFGKQRKKLLIVGLAPGAHGANRTGRMFTGDRSGDWLYESLFHHGFANQPGSTSVEDGLKLSDCIITAVCHCAPPGNKPSGDEIANCKNWLLETLELSNPMVIVCLGQIAWNSTFSLLKESGFWNGKRPKFSHAAIVECEKQFTVIGSYHPSQQNTFTGRLTRKMLDSVFKKARRICDKDLY